MNIMKKLINPACFKLMFPVFLAKTPKSNANITPINNRKLTKNIIQFDIVIKIISQIY